MLHSGLLSTSSNNENIKKIGLKSVRLIFLVPTLGLRRPCSISPNKAKFSSQNNRFPSTCLIVLMYESMSLKNTLVNNQNGRENEPKQGDANFLAHHEFVLGGQMVNNG